MTPFDYLGEGFEWTKQFAQGPCSFLFAMGKQICSHTDAIPWTSSYLPMSPEVAMPMYSR